MVSEVREPESGKIAILLDLIPTIAFAVLAVVDLAWSKLPLWPAADFAIFYIGFTILPWGMALPLTIAIRKRFDHRPRWLRSFIVAASAFLFYYLTTGAQNAFAEEATARLRLVTGDYGPGLFDGPWCFYTDNSGSNWGKGLAGIWQGTTYRLEAGWRLFPWKLAFLLIICISNDYLIRLRKFIFKAAFPLGYQGKYPRLHVFLELLPLSSAALFAFGLLFWMHTIFTPDPILVPWIYLVDVLPWIFVLTLAYAWCRRIGSKFSPLRSIYIALVGLWIAWTLFSILGNINDEIGARRRAEAGSSDPYALYGDVGGMRNHGTSRLGCDTFEAFLGSVEGSVIFLPFFAGIAWTIFMILNDRKIIEDRP